MDQDRIATVKNKLQGGRVILQKLSYHESVPSKVIKESLDSFDEAVNMLNSIAGWEDKTDLRKDMFRLRRIKKREALRDKKR